MRDPAGESRYDEPPNFHAVAWGSPSWKRGYRRRSAVERINARLDQVYGIEVHLIRGFAKMQGRVGLRGDDGDGTGQRVYRTGRTRAASENQDVKA